VSPVLSAPPSCHADDSGRNLFGGQSFPGDGATPSVEGPGSRLREHPNSPAGLADQALH